MRDYRVKARKLLDDGSIELTGRWTALQWIAIGLGSGGAALLQQTESGWLALVLLTIVAVLLFAPPRRVVTFDRVARLVRKALSLVLDGNEHILLTSIVEGWDNRDLVQELQSLIA